MTLRKKIEIIWNSALLVVACCLIIGGTHLAGIFLNPQIDSSNELWNEVCRISHTIVRIVKDKL